MATALPNRSLTGILVGIIIGLVVGFAVAQMYAGSYLRYSATDYATGPAVQRVGLDVDYQRSQFNKRATSTLNQDRLFNEGVPAVLGRERVDVGGIGANGHYAPPAYLQ